MGNELGKLPMSTSSPRGWPEVLPKAVRFLFDLVPTKIHLQRGLGPSSTVRNPGGYTQRSCAILRAFNLCRNRAGWDVMPRGSCQHSQHHTQCQKCGTAPLLLPYTSPEPPVAQELLPWEQIAAESAPVVHRAPSAAQLENGCCASSVSEQFYPKPPALPHTYFL